MGLHSAYRRSHVSKNEHGSRLRIRIRGAKVSLKVVVYFRDKYCDQNRQYDQVIPLLPHVSSLCE